MVAEVKARVAMRDHDLSCELARAEADAARVGAVVTGPIGEYRKTLAAVLEVEQKRGDLEVELLRLERKRREIKESYRKLVDSARRFDGERRKTAEESKQVEKWISDSW
jgi:hypothetical protein